ncbi:MAG: tetratricopeptide repeat protein [Phycisphaerales bacterium]|nr:tetratricopeptide repeat protein [Phycisphaerales bacterium]
MSKSKKSTRRGKKKRRINTRLLTIVSLVTIMAVAVVGGLIYLKYKGSVTRNLAAARAHIEEGEYEMAMRASGKVLYRETGNQDAHALRLAALEGLVPETPERASALYREYLSALAQRAQFSLGDSAFAMAAMKESFSAAISLDSDAYWTMLEVIAEEQRKRFSPGSEAYNHATLMLGLARMRLGQSNFLGDVDETGHVRFPGETELTEFVQLEPESDAGYSRLAFGRMAVARQLGLKGHTMQEMKNLAMAEETYQRAIELNPEGPDTLLAVIRHLYLHKLIGDIRAVSGENLIESRLEELDEFLVKAERVIGEIEGIEQFQMLELVRFLTLIDLVDGDARAAAILEAWIAEHPEDLHASVMLASRARSAGDLERAAEIADVVLTSDTLPVSLGSSRQQYDKLAAAIAQFAIISNKRDRADSDLLDRDAVRIRDVVVDLVGGNAEHPLVLQLDGQLEYRRGNYVKAVAAFEAALPGIDKPSTAVLRQAADALRRIGQGGLAATRLEQAISIEPRSISHRFELASLYAILKKEELGLEVLSKLPAKVREANPAIQRLEQSLAVGRLRPEERVAAAEALNDPVLKAIAYADQCDREARLDEAIPLLEALIEEGYAEDQRLLVALSQVHAKLGQKDAAKGWISKALELQPTNSRLQGLLRQLSIEDPIELMKESLRENHTEDEARDVAICIFLQEFAKSHDAKAGQIEKSDPEQSAEYRALAVRARAESEALEPILLAAIDRNQQAFAYVFETLLSEQKFAEAEQMLPAASRLLNEGVGGASLPEARLLFARGQAKMALGEDGLDDLKRSAIAARRATEVMGWHNEAWRVLAESMYAIGEWEESRIAYEQLIARDPTAIDAIRNLAALHLQEGGDPTRAVSLLADASRRFSGDRSVRESWLVLEAAHGNPALALFERQRAWIESPEDRNAALWYAGMLASLTPDRSLYLDEQGQPVISGRAWLGMSKSNQDQLLDQLHADWRKKLEVIADKLAKGSDATLREAIQHATVLREAGRHSEMLVVLKRYLDEQRSADNAVTQAIQAAGFLGRSGRLMESKNLLLDYRDDQDLKTLEVDIALGSLLHSIGDCEGALPFLAASGEAQGNLEMKFREIDCLNRLGRLDESEALIATLSAESPNNYQIVMLNAGLQRARGTIAEASGDMEEAIAFRQAFRAALNQASDIDPERAGPYAELVRSLVLEYRRTLDRDLLEQAMRYLDASTGTVQTSEMLAIERANVLEEMGDPRRAAIDLGDYLRRFPESRKARRRLAESFVAAGTPGRALEILEQAIRDDPRDPYWYALLADHIRRSSGDIEQAISHYIASWNLEPNTDRLIALLDVTRTDKPWDYQAAINAIDANRDQLANDPRIVGLRARAESGLGLSSRARESLREAYMAHASSVKRGDTPPLFIVEWYEDLYTIFPDGDPSEAIELVDTVTGGNPSRWDRRGLARYYMLRGGDEISDAIAILQGIVAENDVELLAADLRSLGSAQLAFGEDQDAAETFKRILEITPNDAVALNNYAYLLAVILGDPVAAEPLARRAVGLRPREPIFIDTMATIQMKLGNYQAALSSLLARLSLEPNNGQLLSNIALMLADDLDRPNEAVPYAERALALDPRGAETLDVAGWVEWRAGDTAKGRDRVGQSIRRQPTAKAHLHMARILVAANESDKARDHLQQAENLAIDDSVRKEIQKVQDDLDTGN